MTFWTFNINQIVKQPDAVMVGQHIKSSLTIWASCHISSGGIQEFRFQGFDRFLKGKDLGLKFLDLFLEVLSGQYTGIGQDFFGI
jgi:hypothetical protein